MNLEILLVTTQKKDISFLDSMNIQSNIIVANQNDQFNRELIIKKKYKANFINTNTKGVGINRNLALLFSEAEYCLLADDDEIFHNGYQDIILNAFQEIPDADILIFNVNMLSDNSKTRENTSVSKVSKFNFSNYGAVRIAFKREKIMRKNIWFSTKFGGGAEFSSGEDSLFLKECLDKGLKIYTAPYYIANVKQEKSSWFNGFTEKYFIDKGAFISVAFPRIKYLVAIYFSLKFRKVSNFTALEIYSFISKGIKEYI